MPKITVQPMSAKDMTETLDQIMDLAIIANPWAERERYKEYEVSLFQQYPHLAFVAVESGRIVGYVMGDSKADEGEVEELAVLPGHRGNGLGRRLLEAELSALKNVGVKSVVVWVGWKNAASIPFYYKFGFRVSNSVLDRAGPGEDAIYLKKDL